MSRGKEVSDEQSGPWQRCQSPLVIKSMAALEGACRNLLCWSVGGSPGPYPVPVRASVLCTEPVRPRRATLLNEAVIAPWPHMAAPPHAVQTLKLTTPRYKLSKPTDEQHISAATGSGQTICWLPDGTLLLRASTNSFRTCQTCSVEHTGAPAGFLSLLTWVHLAEGANTIRRQGADSDLGWAPHLLIPRSSYTPPKPARIQPKPETVS